MKSFASDNFASVHPKVMEALAAANVDHSMAYGDDPWTARAIETIRREFQSDADVYFVYGGTGANVCGLEACVERFDSVLCASSAHIYTDECGAPERYLGIKLQTIPATNGKLSVEALSKFVGGDSSEHHVRARVVSLTQSTELGTLYTVEELKEIGNFCRQNDLYFHMDGARLYNAACALGVELREISSEVGVDILSLGGTKNGLMYGEAVLVFNPKIRRDMRYIRKQSMQLASKMRYIAAQFEALFCEQLWRANAQHANAMAEKLRQGLKDSAHVSLVYPSQVNALFVKIPAKLREELLKESFFWDWDTAEGVVRWMTSFDTRIEDIEKFVTRVKAYRG